MIQYCMFNWPKRKIRKDGLKWPKHGSSEMWLCKAWYSYVHYRASKNSDELEYAKIWLNYWEKQEKEPKKVLPISEKPKEKPKRKLNQPKWDPLDVPPPANHSSLTENDEKDVDFLSSIHPTSNKSDSEIDVDDQPSSSKANKLNKQSNSSLSSWEGPAFSTRKKQSKIECSTCLCDSQKS